ncbi:MAG: DUF2868 domain-containing protein [Oceanospirillaceae bacterium]
MATEQNRPISNGLAALVFCAAIFSSALLIGGDQFGRVNLLYLLLLFVAWPVLSLMFALFLYWGKSEKGLVVWLLTMPIWPKPWLLNLNTLKHQGLLSLWVFTQSQKLALVFSAGCILSFIFVLLFNDVSFVWRSTLLQAEQIYPLLNWLAKPWFFIDQAQPVLAMVEISQDSRLSLNPQLSSTGVWWRYIFWAQLCYAVTPRLLLYIWGAKKLQQLEREALASSQKLAHTADHDASLAQKSAENAKTQLTEVISNDHHLGDYVLLSWVQLPQALLNKLTAVLGMPVAVYQIGAQASLESEQQALQDTRKKLLIVAAWEPPMGELEDFMQQTTGIIMPLDWQGEQFQTISDLHLDEWRRFCYPLSRWQLQQLGVLI